MLVKATEIKNNLGKYLTLCVKEDIIITKHAQRVAVLKSLEGNQTEGSSFSKEESAVYNAFDKTHPPLKMSYIDFKNFTANTEDRYELIDGIVYMLAAPRVAHQYALSKIHSLFSVWFEEKRCIPFFAPFDITLNLHRENPDVVQPDLMVICDLEEHMDKNGYYMGVPALVLEVISGSTRKKDMLTKLNLYMRSGILEYWIANPLSREITVFLFESNNIKNNRTFTYGMSCESYTYPGLQIRLDKVFM